MAYLARVTNVSGDPSYNKENYIAVRSSANADTGGSNFLSSLNRIEFPATVSNEVLECAFIAEAGSTYIHLLRSGVGYETVWEDFKIIPILKNFQQLFGWVDGLPSASEVAVNGTLTASALTVGGVAGLSGFDSSGDNLEAANPWDGVGTDEAWLAFAFKSSVGSDPVVFYAINYHNGTAYVTGRVQIYFVSGVIRAYVTTNGGSTSVIAGATTAYNDDLLHTVVFRKTADSYILSVDDETVATVAVGAHGDITFDASAKAMIGYDGALNSAPDTAIWFGCGGKAALSDIEVSLMHQYMRNLIEGKTSLDEIPTETAYDPIRNAAELVGTARRQTFQDGAITASVAHGRGTGSAVAVGMRSEIAVGGATTVQANVPERNLREKTLTLVPERKTVTYEGDATGLRVLFPDPTNDAEVAQVVGWRPVLVHDDGVEQTKGPADDYTVADYGLGRYCVEFATEPADGNNVDIVFEREVWK